MASPREDHRRSPARHHHNDSDSSKKRRRSNSPDRRPSKRIPDDPQDDLPQPYDAKALAPAKRVVPSNERKQKRPGQRSRISEADRDAIRARQRQREREQEERERQEQERQRPGNTDVVRQHYNSVPERGRDWRLTSSHIKGLRGFNNWVKSCIIQRYSQSAEFGKYDGGHHGRPEDLLVLDIGCGKGGDLQKWTNAPQPVALYVGLDPAEVSIDQAHDRYRQMTSRHRGRPPRMDARFIVKDCFNNSIEDIPIVREVGFDPTGVTLPPNRGFDVVSMMFCMHYAYESEQLARNMLRNVAGALKKGGRFIGTIPNSDVLSSNVVKFNKMMAEKRAKKAEKGKRKETNSDAPDSGEAVEKKTEEGGEGGEDGEEGGEDGEEGGEDGEVDDGEGKKGTEAQQDTESNDAPKPKSDSDKEEGEAGEEDDEEEGEAEDSAEWGNKIYRVRFPGETPDDGVFRPPYGWKYNFFLDEAVDSVPEYVVPWEAFRALAEEFNLELQYHDTFRGVWDTEKDDRELGGLSERMGVRERGSGKLMVSDEEMEAAGFYLAFCFYKV